MWTANYPQNNIATGTVGGNASDGAFAIYSLPHGMTTDSGSYCDTAEDPNIPLECYQNDGLKIESAAGATFHAFGGRIDTANSGKVTFLLDGVDINGNFTDNIGNWQREGDSADNWAFVGVLDEEGFQSAELRELRGKDFQQVFLFADNFLIAVRSFKGDINNDGNINLTDTVLALKVVSNIAPPVSLFKETDVNGDGLIGLEEAIYALQVTSGLKTPSDNTFVGSKLTGMGAITNIQD